MRRDARVGVRSEDMPHSISGDGEGEALSGSHMRSLRQIRELHVRRVLAATEFDLARAAQVLGVAETRLRALIERLRIQVPHRT